MFRCFVVVCGRENINRNSEGLYMRPQDIVLNNHYRFRDNPDYSYAKALKVLKPKEAPNTHTYSIVKCEHSINKDDTMGFIRYFRPCDLIKEKIR